MKPEQPDLKRKTLTLFILLFPSILITSIIWAPTYISVILAIFYQFVVIKNFVDSHYD